MVFLCDTRHLFWLGCSRLLVTSQCLRTTIMLSLVTRQMLWNIFTDRKILKIAFISLSVYLIPPLFMFEMSLHSHPCVISSINKTTYRNRSVTTSSTTSSITSSTSSSTSSPVTSFTSKMLPCLHQLLIPVSQRVGYGITFFTTSGLCGKHYFFFFKHSFFFIRLFCVKPLWVCVCVTFSSGWGGVKKDLPTRNLILFRVSRVAAWFF